MTRGTGKARKPVRRAKKAPPKTGPTKLTAERTAEFAAAIARGESIETAAELIGVTTRTVRGWVTRGGAEPDSPYGPFAQAVADAKRNPAREALSEEQLLLVMEKAAKNGSLTATKFLLERQWPERWAPASRTAKPKDGDDEPADGFEALDRDELAPRRSKRTQAA